MSKFLSILLIVVAIVFGNTAYQGVNTLGASVSLS
jgi:hypothetical protein